MIDEELASPANPLGLPFIHRIPWATGEENLEAFLAIGLRNSYTAAIGVLDGLHLSDVYRLRRGFLDTIGMAGHLSRTNPPGPFDYLDEQVCPEIESPSSDARIYWKFIGRTKEDDLEFALITDGEDVESDGEFLYLKAAALATGSGWVTGYVEAEMANIVYRGVQPVETLEPEIHDE